MPQGPLPPGPGRPYAPHMLRYQREPIAFVERCARRHGPVFSLRLPFVGTAVLAVDPGDIATILTQAPARFAVEPAASRLAPVVGETAMMFATGAAHRRQRSALWPVFHGPATVRWEERMAAVAEQELAGLPAHEPVATLPVARRIAVRVLSEIALGAPDSDGLARLHCEVGRRDDPRLALMLLFPTLWTRGGRLNPGRPLKRRRETINRLLLEQIALRRARGGENGAPREDALSLLVAARDEQGTPLSDAQVRDQLVGLMLVGHETAAAALAWAFERLARCADARERLAQELDDARETPYLDAFVQETLRLRPPILDAVRTTTAPLELGGHVVPAGVVASAVCAVAQRHPAWWEDPLAFRPERFLGDAAAPAPAAFAPFGGGARRCLAASLSTTLMRTVVRALVARAVVVPAPGAEERARLFGTSLLPSRGARVVLRPHPARRAHSHSARSSSISGGRVASQLG